MVLSLKELVDKTKELEAAKQVTQELEARSVFDASEFDIFGTGETQREQRIAELSAEDKTQIAESVRSIPFARMVKEFLASSGTTGIAGAAYLIPTKIHTMLFDSAKQADITGDISIAVLDHSQGQGKLVRVDIEADGQFVVMPTSSGAIMPDETKATTYANLDYSNIYGINFPLANDLIEDSQFDLLDLHIRNAGAEIGEYASNLALTVLKTATDGDGTVNGGLSGNAAETMFTGAGTTDLVDLHRQITDDQYFPNTLILTPQAFWHSIVTTTLIAAGTYSEPFAYNVIVDALPKRLLGCNIIWRTDPTLHYTDDASGTFTRCVSIMFDKAYALLTGRKRWMRIENYSNPVRDLKGAVVTFRQDSVSIYNDSIGVITETP
jgi:HK97 family phage major capsid protein